MVLAPRLRRLALTIHLTSSVGWLGAVVAYLALAVVGMTSESDVLVRSVYILMAVIGWAIIVPFCLASLLTGLVSSLGTSWGLFRHYWILVKFILTVLSTVVLLVHMRTVSQVAQSLAESAVAQGSEFAMLQKQLLVHPAGGLIILVAATVIAIYKPWGPIRATRKYS